MLDNELVVVFQSRLYCAEFLLILARWFHGKSRILSLIVLHYYNTLILDRLD